MLTRVTPKPKKNKATSSGSTYYNNENFFLTIQQLAANEVKICWFFETKKEEKTQPMVRIHRPSLPASKLIAIKQNVHADILWIFWKKYLFFGTSRPTRRLSTNYSLYKNKERNDMLKF
jgi:hypothetical protein